MKCLYCGGPLTLALLKKITGAGEFCSDECRRGYQSEFNRLAVGRLQQARVNRRVVPTGGGLNVPEGPAGVVSAVLEDQTPADVLRPIGGFSPLPDTSPSIAQAIEQTMDAVPDPPYLAQPKANLARPKANLETEAAQPEHHSPQLDNLSRALESTGKPPTAHSQSAAKSADEAEELWMAPRGPLPMTPRLQAIPADLKTPAVSPAPIFVYLQLPESLIANSLGRPQLWVAPLAVSTAAAVAAGRESPSGKLEPMWEGIVSPCHRAPRMTQCQLVSPSGFTPEQTTGLTFAWPSSGEPTAMPNLQFRPPSPALPKGADSPLSGSDPRFDIFLRADGRKELREKLRGLSDRRAAQRAGKETEPTVTLPLKTVEPALNLLAAFGTAMLERQTRLGDFPPAMSGSESAMTMPTEELLPKLTAGLHAMPPLRRPAGPEFGEFAGPSSPSPASSLAAPLSLGEHPGGRRASDYRDGSVAASPTTDVTPGWSHGESRVPPSQPHPSIAPLPPTPPLDAGGLPSGWPTGVPAPAELAAPQASELAPAPAAFPSPAPAAFASPTPAAEPPALPGMPAISGNVYMFGTEINGGAGQNEETSSTALAKRTDEELEKVGPAEAESAVADEPNFTRPGGFPLSGGGMMNVGTMVVVNQPSGTVNINANSATASTFESRLRQKEPTPLSSIAAPAGLQIPVPEPAKEMPLRMNFQGRLNTALAVKWPELDAIAMRKKMFYGSPVKARRPGGAESLASAPAPRPRPAAARPAGGPIPPEPASETEKPGAMNWIKSISGRFGKK